jgi:ABC-type multidrug transport system fused ATPase/permease subunit
MDLPNNKVNQPGKGGQPGDGGQSGKGRQSGGGGQPGKSGQHGSGDKSGKGGQGNENRPKGGTIKILKRLSRYLLDYKVTILVVVLSFLASAALSLTPAWLVKNALDNYLLPDKVTLLWLSALAMFGAAILQGGTDFITRYLAESKGQLIVYQIRQSVYKHLMQLSFSYYDQSRMGDLMSRLTADAETLQSFFGFASVHIVSNSLFLLGVLVVMFIWNVQLALLYIFLLPLIVFGITRYAFRVRPSYGKIRRMLGTLTEYLHEQLRGMPVIKIFGREQDSVKDFARLNNRFLSINLEAGRITSFWMPYVFVLIGMGTGLVIWFGGARVISGAITLGTLVGFTTYIGMMMRPIRQTGMLTSQVLVAAAAAERIFEILDTKPEIQDEPGAIDLTEVTGEITYDHVSFSYDKKTPILQDVSFTARPGETIAIVGPTGAGKTTLVHLLPRFYDAGSGAILVDGRPIRSVTLASLRRHIGIVMQHTFLFNATLRENIAFGRPDAEMEAIRAAAQAAEIDDFIMDLPEKYETMVGERGVNLSGGQQQRIAIARTLLLDPKLLILDEPTASVDAQTDAKIQSALNRLCQNRTVFIIAHRLWTLKNADRILVLENGNISQFGTHDELIREPGLYREIYTLQISGEQYDIESGRQPEAGEA